MQTYDIDEMPMLMKKLGRSRTAQIKYSKVSDTSRPKRGQWIENDLLGAMQGRRMDDEHCNISDIIAGVCRLDHYGQKGRNIPLSMTMMYGMLQTLEFFCTREIAKFCECEERQARRYMKALTIVMPFLREALQDEAEIYIDEVIVPTKPIGGNDD